MDNRFYFGFNTSEERKKRRKAELYSMSEQVSTFFWDEAPQHGLEMREGQQDMSFEIVDALINDQHFAIEAGVGIGKSFGYLVPVLLYSKRMNKPVIIATSTIALQEQLWRDVHAVMPLLGLNRDVILAKGQTHYLCNKRADEYMCDPKCALPGFVDSKNEEKTERNAGYLVVSHSGGGMLRQGTRKGIRRTPANRGMRAHRIVKSLDISEDVCHGLCP